MAGLFRPWHAGWQWGVLAVCLIVAGCASSQTRNTESLLSAAGFHTVTPSTPEQQATFNALEPYRVQRREKDGEVIYAYADTKSRLLYLGGETEYQRYHELGLQKRIADDQLRAAQMNQNAAMSWGAGWGPRAVIW